MYSRVFAPYSVVSTGAGAAGSTISNLSGSEQNRLHLTASPQRSDLLAVQPNLNAAGVADFHLRRVGSRQGLGLAGLSMPEKIGLPSLLVIESHACSVAARFSTTWLTLSGSGCRGNRDARQYCRLRRRARTGCSAGPAARRRVIHQL